MAETPETTAMRSAEATRERTSETTIAWLEQEFPGWTFSVDETATWEGDLRPLWIARRSGHHPQAELTAAKLHTRLAEYLERETRRHALTN